MRATQAKEIAARFFSCFCCTAVSYSMYDSSTSTAHVLVCFFYARTVIFVRLPLLYQISFTVYAFISYDMFVCVYYRRICSGRRSIPRGMEGAPAGVTSKHINKTYLVPKYNRCTITRTSNKCYPGYLCSLIRSVPVHKNLFRLTLLLALVVARSVMSICYLFVLCEPGLVRSTTPACSFPGVDGLERSSLRQRPCRIMSIPVYTHMLTHIRAGDSSGPSEDCIHAGS